MEAYTSPSQAMLRLLGPHMRLTETAPLLLTSLPPNSTSTGLPAPFLRPSTLLLDEFT